VWHVLGEADRPEVESARDKPLTGRLGGERQQVEAGRQTAVSQSPQDRPAVEKGEETDAGRPFGAGART
jgi:hypothetical protein